MKEDEPGLSDDKAPHTAQRRAEHQCDLVEGGVGDESPPDPAQ